MTFSFSVFLPNFWFTLFFSLSKNKIPKKSKKWLLDQGIIAKGFDKKEFVKKEIEKDLKVDDYDTEFEEE